MVQRIRHIVCRIAKLNSWTKVAIAHAHNRRTTVPLHCHADLTHLNRLLLGSGDVRADVHAAVDRVDGALRKNGVIAVEMILTAAAGWFNADHSRLDAFVSRCMAQLRDRYGERLVAADLHLDEDAPHIHAVIVPLEINRHGKMKLNARGEFGGFRKMQQLQDWAGGVGAPLGLLRGEVRQYEGRARHKSPAAYRAELAEEIAAVKSERARLAEMDQWYRDQVAALQEWEAALNAREETLGREMAEAWSVPTR